MEEKTKMTETKLFNSSANNHKYNVVIEVYENACVTHVDVVNKAERQMTYHELIGILEAQKQHIMWSQREKNLKANLIVPKKKKKIINNANKK